MGSLESFVKRVLKLQIKEKYPHIQHPAGVYAKVTKVQKDKNSSTVTLKVLNRILQEDESMPEIPYVPTTLQLEKDDIVVALLLYSGSEAHILGRYES